MNIIKKLTALVSVMLVLATVSCKKWGGEGGGSEGSFPKNCVKTGFLFKPACGYSAIGENLWIMGDDGKIYQACVLDQKSLEPNAYKQGDRVRFGTRSLTSDESCKWELILCAPPVTMPDYQVGITCITIESEKEETATGFFVNLTGKLDGCGWVFESNDGVRFEVGAWHPASSISEKEKATIVFKKNKNAGSICMVGTSIDIFQVKYLIPQGACSKKLLLHKSSDTKNTVGIEKAWLVGTQLKLMLTFGGCDFTPDPISLHLESVQHASDPPQVFLALGNQPKEQLCQAYFRKEVCYDVSELRQYGKYLRLVFKDLKHQTLTLKFE